MSVRKGICEGGWEAAESLQEVLGSDRTFSPSSFRLHWKTGGQTEIDGQRTQRQNKDTDAGQAAVLGIQVC